MKKSYVIYGTLILVSFLLLLITFWPVVWVGEDKNREAYYFCKGRGYGQGAELDGYAICQTYTVKQDKFKLPL